MAAYIVFTNEHTRDLKELELYVKDHEAFIAGHALTYRARFGRYEVLEGSKAEGIAILEFPTYDEAKAWYRSRAYQEASKHRYFGGDFRCILVEGV
ncbi:MAG TPA: DUF1330 domain-containing protein [Polyangiaceae bacterium]|nr:DUF1330 domain-containing protein [Polyangiaceae bacterium]